MILFVLIMALSLANGIESITTVLKQEGKDGGSKTVLLNQIQRNLWMQRRRKDSLGKIRS